MTVTSHYHLSGSGSYVADTNNCAVATMVPTSRLPGAVTAVANDGDFLWVATTTRFDPSLSGNGIEGQWVDGYFVLTLRPGISTGKGGKKGNWRNMYVGGERNDILLLHKPTGRWVGYFPATSRVTGLAVSDEKLWVGLEDKGYVQEAAHSWQDQEVFAPSPLLEVQKTPLLSIPPDQWVSDTISENEIRSRTQEAIRVLRTPPATESPDPGAAAGERYEFLQRNFGRFVPVEFKKSSNGDAVVQRLSVRGHLMEHAGEYYCGFRFTFPTWLDGDFEWMYALAKTESEKDFTSAITFGLVQENGPWAEPESLRRDNLHNYRELRQQFPYSYSLNLEDFSKDQLQPGKTYCVWFALPEKNHPDIAFAMTIHSERGTNEIGVLPLH